MENPQLSALAQRGVGLNPFIFNADKTDYLKPELFLGQPGGLLDSIHQAYPDLFQQYEELKTLDWKHNEFEYWRCVAEFKTVSPSIYQKMIRTLAWQWEGDTVAARGLADVLVPLCTCMESRVGYGRIIDNENLHALTYSEIVRGSFEDPAVILDEIMAVRESHGRMAIVGEIFAQAREASLEWQRTGVRTPQIEEAVLMLIAAVYLLERVQFMASFAVTFAICELGLFEPIGSAVQMICRDEYSVHVKFGEKVLAHVLKTAWGQRAFQAVRPRLIAAIVELCQNEMAWVDYLHSDGEELPGVTPQKFKDWTLFCAFPVTVTFGVQDEVEAALGVKLPQQLPLNYMRDWIDINEKQASPQEQDNNNYLINTVSAENVSNKPIDAGFSFDFD